MSAPLDSSHIHVSIKEERNGLGKLIGCVFCFSYFDSVVGDVWLIRIGERSFESHSSINEERFRGRGLGIHMYTVVAGWLLERGLILKSTPIANQTLAARRLWNSTRLRRHFQITKKYDRWVISNTMSSSVLLAAKKKNTFARTVRSHASVAARRQKL